MSMAVTESTGSFTRLFIVPYFIDLALNKINPSIDYSSRPYLEASSSAVADDWETGEAQQEEQLKNKQQQVGILVLLQLSLFRSSTRIVLTDSHPEAREGESRGC